MDAVTTWNGRTSNVKLSKGSSTSKIGVRIQNLCISPKISLVSHEISLAKFHVLVFLNTILLLHGPKYGMHGAYKLEIISACTY